MGFKYRQTLFVEFKCDSCGDKHKQSTSKEDKIEFFHSKIKWELYDKGWEVPDYKEPPFYVDPDEEPKKELPTLCPRCNKFSLLQLKIKLDEYVHYTEEGCEGCGVGKGFLIATVDRIDEDLKMKCLYCAGVLEK